MNNTEIQKYLEFLDRKVEAPVKLFSSYTTNALYNFIWTYYISELARKGGNNVCLYYKGEGEWSYDKYKKYMDEARIMTDATFRDIESIIEFLVKNNLDLNKAIKLGIKSVEEIKSKIKEYAKLNNNLITK